MTHRQSPTQNSLPYIFAIGCLLVSSLGLSRLLSADAAPAASPLASPLVATAPAPTATARATATATPVPPSPTPIPALSAAPDERIPTPAPTSTATPAPLLAAPAPTVGPVESIPTYPSNHEGQVLVLVYHGIGWPEGRWQRTPDNFRADLERLLSLGYYPVNLIDYATGNLGDVPAGRRPVVLTFDDSSAGQFRYLEDGLIDPHCAVGVLLAMHQQYGGDWPLRATFYVLLDSGDTPGYPLFRQPDLAAQKVQQLVAWGMEVASHTITHPQLDTLSSAQVQWELAVAQNRIEGLMDGYYPVRSLALPYGTPPLDLTLLRAGHSDSADLNYHYDAVVWLRGGPSLSPFAADFDPFYIPRVQAIQAQLDQWLTYFEQHPEAYYVQ